MGLVFLGTGIAAVSLIRSYPTMAISLTLMPIGTAFVFPCTTAMLSRVVSSRDRGLYMGVQHTFGGVSRVAIPILAGYAMDMFGKGIPFVIAGAIVLLSLLLTLSMEKYSQPLVVADGRSVP
jgi:MFS family permease